MVEVEAAPLGRCLERPSSPEVAPALAALVPLERLESLEVGGKLLQQLAPQLLAPAAAAALTALRSLSVHFCQPRWAIFPWIDGIPEPGAPFWALWREPWLARLTQLRIDGPGLVFARLADALAPRALASLRDLRLAIDDAAPLPPAVLGTLLAACDPAALKALFVHGVDYADAARLAESLPALESLALTAAASAPPPGTLRDPRLRLRAPPPPAVPAWQALAPARLAPLTSLALIFVSGGWAQAGPDCLGAPLAAPWAASLRKVVLQGPLTAAPGDVPLRPLAALSQLRALTCLRLIMPGLSAAALRAAAAAGVVEGWAPRLVRLEVVDDGAGADAARAWLQLLSGARRLARLGITADLSALERDELMAEVARALPAVSRVTWAAEDLR